MGATDYHADTDLKLPDGGVASGQPDGSAVPRHRGNSIGYMLVLEDITREKRVRNTMARYVARRSSIGCSRAATMSSRAAIWSPPCCFLTSGASR